ncbi:MAG: FliI/YscN family ATPase [Desulfobacterota bacterium]|nr:FliI/YscN family ATPase [Thermodesulfobacteriota bacterium]MDW8002796.1 FliI/YscN family ATPase [Deltaproteobacteria bacterium]
MELGKIKEILSTCYPYKIYGKVEQVVGLVIEGRGPISSIGDSAQIFPFGEAEPIEAEVVGFKDGKTLLMPLGDIRGIGIGSKIMTGKQSAFYYAGETLLGRVIDGLGNPLDGKGEIRGKEPVLIYRRTVNPMRKKMITEPLDVGVRSINGLLTCGKGQRIGIFAGSGVGKSVLLGMIAKHTSADVNVIALIGERGREVKEFIERDLGHGLERSVVVVATSDEAPLIRVRGAYLAVAIAEYFRDKGYDVLFMMDSLTRFAMAQREVGLAIGEPPTTKGYTPSVFSHLAKLLERTGNGENGGSMTAIYTVLVEGDDLDDPIADASRAILDGHIVLSRKLADSNIYPAVDVLRSVSRVMRDVVSKEQMEYASRIVEIISEYERAEDLINIGAYVAGTNRKIDYAISMIEKVRLFLKQDVDEKVTLEDAINAMKILLAV